MQMQQKVGTAMAILYVVLVNENNCGLVYEEQETYEGHCFVETGLQKFVSSNGLRSLYRFWVLGFGL